MNNNKFFEVKFKKNEMKSLMKKIALLQMYYLTVGIHKGQGTRLANSTSSSKINIATLAHWLEEGASWVQSKTIRIPSKLPVGNPATGKIENFVTIFKGTHINVPSRLFISLNKIPYVWSNIKNFTNNAIKMFIGLNRGTGNAKKFFEILGIEIERNQKQRITNGFGVDGNSPTTEKIKGFNHPLLDSGNMLDSIRYKINKNFGKGEKKIAKLKYLTEIENMFKDLK